VRAAEYCNLSDSSKRDALSTPRAKQLGAYIQFNELDMQYLKRSINGCRLFRLEPFSMAWTAIVARTSCAKGLYFCL
jgi:hypothetical protein